MSDFETVARVGDIPAGEGRSYCVRGRMIGVYFVDGEYFALTDVCPHMGASMVGGPVENKAVMCPWHAWRFSLCDGSWLDAPKSKVRAETYEVRVIGDEIQVAIPRSADGSAAGDQT
jgi:nitrite reductase (NADH) small subunit/3-phenylpropionate/trans-cinnamate dioxygenase ferredoxin subunit